MDRQRGYCVCVCVYIVLNKSDFYSLPFHKHTSLEITIVTTPRSPSFSTHT